VGGTGETLGWGERKSATGAQPKRKLGKKIDNVEESLEKWNSTLRRGGGQEERPKKKKKKKNNETRKRRKKSEKTIWIQLKKKKSCVLKEIPTCKRSKISERGKMCVWGREQNFPWPRGKGR